MEVNYENIQALLTLLKEENEKILSEIERFKIPDNEYYKYRSNRFLEKYFEKGDES